MKVNRENVFEPITIILETQVEVDILYALLSEPCAEALFDGKDEGLYSILEKSYEKDYVKKFEDSLRYRYGKEK